MDRGTDNVSNFSTFYTRPVSALPVKDYEALIRVFVRLEYEKKGAEGGGQKLLSPLSRLLHCKDDGGGTIVTTLAFIIVVSERGLLAMERI